MQRPVGTGCNSGVQNRLELKTPPSTGVYQPPLLNRGDRVSKFRDPNNEREGCDLFGDKPRRRISVHHFHSPKKGWGTQTYIQPKEVESVHSSPSLQDGRNSHVKRPLETRGPYGKDRLEGRLLCGTDKRARQEIPEVQVERYSLSVQLSTFWTVMCSLGL